MDTKIVVIFDNKGHAIMDTCCEVYNELEEGQEIVQSFVACTEKFIRMLAHYSKMPEPTAFDISQYWAIMEKQGYSAKVCDLRFLKVGESISANDLAKDIMSKLTPEQMEALKEEALKALKSSTLTQGAKPVEKRFKGGVDRYKVTPEDVGLN